MKTSQTRIEKAEQDFNDDHIEAAFKELKKNGNQLATTAITVKN